MFPVNIKIDEDCDNLLRKSLLINLIDLHYQQEASIVDFYYKYRNVVMACLRKKGDIILWQNKMVLAEDEQLSPTFEELILVNVLGLIDTRLLAFVRDKYQRLGYTKCLMDYQTDILMNVHTFIEELKCNPPAVFKSDVEKLSR